MKFHKQKFLHDPDNGVYGDCHRTAIACLLDLEQDEVPHFLYDGCDAVEFKRREKEFLNSRGLNLFEVDYGGEIKDVMNYIASVNPNIPYLLYGKSPRGTCHTVVCVNNKMMHDPHPDDTFVCAPCGSEAYYRIAILTPLIRLN